MAHVCGLGYLLDKGHVRTTLQAIMRHNFKEGFTGHFNHLRSFVLGGESALLMATYPRGRRPARPFPYYNEVMTGFEYTAAVGMLYEGMEEEALEVIAAIRARYDGRKRSPFDEAECGHHYARAMAAWGAVLAMSGFEYSGVDKAMRFAARPGTWFWSNGSAWGMCRILKKGKAWSAELNVVHGKVELALFSLHEIGERAWDTPQAVAAGKTLKVRLS
jgi:hypothetical protein